MDELLALRVRARSRLETYNLEGTFAAVAGLVTDSDEIRLGESLVVRRLPERPQIYGSSLATSLPVNHEIHFEIPKENSMEEWIFDGVFWTVVALLRTVTKGHFLVTEISDYSWAVTDGLEQGVCRSRILRQSTPYWSSKWTATPLDMQQAEWVGARWYDALGLRKEAKFHFILECLETSFLEQDPRMAVTKTWAGIEAFLGASIEIKFRLSMLLSAALESPGSSRIVLYEKLKKMYDMRSRVVHGSSVEAKQILAHLEAAQEILQRIVKLSLENGSIYTMKELEHGLLAPNIPQSANSTQR